MKYVTFESTRINHIDSSINALAKNNTIHRIWYSSCGAGTQYSREYNYSAIVEYEPKPKENGV